MNRRSFISSMLAACAAPLALNGAGRTWKNVESLLVPEVAILNPEWVNAPFEVRWIWNNSPTELNLHSGIVKRGNHRTENDFPDAIKDPYPMRYRDANLQEFIQPFIFRQR